MPSKILTDGLVSRIHARRRDGLSRSQLAAEFNVATGTITNALKEPDPGPIVEPDEQPAKPTPKRMRKARSSSANGKKKVTADPADKGAMTFEEMRDSLTWSTRAMMRMLETATKGNDKTVLGNLAPKLTQLVKELRHLTPPAPANPEDNPDMQAAAKRAREKILERVRRAARGNAA